MLPYLLAVLALLLVLEAVVRPHIERGRRRRRAGAIAHTTKLAERRLRRLHAQVQHSLLEAVANEHKGESR
jgi:hypothetical protein